MEMHKTLISNYSTKAHLSADILVSTVTCLEALIRKNPSLWLRTSPASIQGDNITMTTGQDGTQQALQKGCVHTDFFPPQLLTFFLCKLAEQ